MQYLSTDAPLAVATVKAIRSGDIPGITALLSGNPELAVARIGGPTCKSGGMEARSLLHIATDWPGHFPNGPEIVAALVAAGADPNARFEGGNAETPLHWAASSDDVAVLDALLDHGADIEATGAVIGGGTAIADATAFGQWKAARRLLERGAKTSLWEAAALGLMDRIQSHFHGDELPAWKPGPSQSSGPDEITHAFWCACHGGQREAAEFLMNRGADINWIGYDNLTPLGAARRTGADDLSAWLLQRGAQTIEELRQ